MNDDMSLMTGTSKEDECMSASGTHQRRHTLTNKQTKDIKASFHLFDHDNDGRITKDEIGRVMRSMGQNPSQSELKAIMKQADATGKGHLDLADFTALMTSKYKEIDNEEAEIRNAFKVFDRDGNGYISVPELRLVLTSIGEKLTAEEIDGILREADLNQDGLIDYEEFSKVLAYKFV